MTPALMRYLATVVDRALDGSVPEGARGSATITVPSGAALRVRLAPPRCRAEHERGETDATVALSWGRLLEVLEAELDADDALAHPATQVTGDRCIAGAVMRQLGRVDLRAVVQANDDVAWQLRINLEGMGLAEIRELMASRYGHTIASDQSKERAIAGIIDLVRRGPLLRAEVRRGLPDPVRVHELDIDGAALVAAYERVKAELPPVENTCWGCGRSEGPPCGSSCRRLATGWSLQSRTGDHLEALFGGPGAHGESEFNVKTPACVDAFADLVDSIPGCCRARLKVYRPGYQTGHAIHTDAGSIVRTVVPVVAPEGPALSVEPYPGAYAGELLLHSYSVHEAGRMYQFPTWLQHCGRNPERERERAFILISQEVEDETVWA